MIGFTAHQTETNSFPGIWWILPCLVMNKSHYREKKKKRKKKIQISGREWPSNLGLLIYFTVFQSIYVAFSGAVEFAPAHYFTFPGSDEFTFPIFINTGLLKNFQRKSGKSERQIFM